MEKALPAEERRGRLVGCWANGLMGSLFRPLGLRGILFLGLRYGNHGLVKQVPGSGRLAVTRWSQPMSCTLKSMSSFRRSVGLWGACLFLMFQAGCAATLVDSPRECAGEEFESRAENLAESGDERAVIELARRCAELGYADSQFALGTERRRYLCRLRSF